MDLLRNKLREERGFTLIEMVVGLLIIGVLAGVAIPIFLYIKGKGWDANAETDVRNSVPVLEMVTMDYAQYNPDTVLLEGFSMGKDMDVEVTVLQGGSGMAVGGRTKVFKGVIKLSPGTRGSIGGTLGNYTICKYNVNGDRWRNPDTAYVWDSAATGTETDGGKGGGTFREATEDDECVKVAKERDPDLDGPTTPDAPGEGEGEGDDGDGSVVIPDAPTGLDVAWNEPYARAGTHWTSPMTVLITYTVRSSEGDDLAGLALTGYLNGTEVRSSGALTSIGSGVYQGALVVGTDTTPAGGVLELRTQGSASRAAVLDLSSYGYLGDWTGSWTQMSARSSDVAALNSWLTDYGIPAGTHSVLIQPMWQPSTYAVHFQDESGMTFEMSDEDIVMSLGTNDFRNLTIYPQAGRAEYVIEQGPNPIVHF